MEIDMKDVVCTVLEECQFSSSRSSKMDIDDFLLLLDLFNKAGIHFV